MKKNRKTYLILFAALALCFILIVVIDMNRTKPLDWSLDMGKETKIPLGGYVVYSVLEDIFPDGIISISDKGIYEKLKSSHYLNTNFLIMTEQLQLGKAGVDVLLQFVESGNRAFIVASYLEQDFLDTLGLELDYALWSVNLQDDSLGINFVNENLKKEGDYFVDARTYPTYFKSIDTLNTEVLGINNSQQTNFIRIKHGEGWIYLHTQPVIFSNFNMLQENNAEYAFKALSYLPNSNVIWDEYYKPNRTENSSFTRYLMSSTGLRYALYLLLASIALYLAFFSKRMQRLVPVIEPMRNSSVEFAETIGRLYMFNKDYRDILLKKYIYLLEYVRKRYYLPTNHIDEAFFKNLSEKSGVNEEQVASIFKSIALIRDVTNISKADLLRINGLIESFYKNSI